MLLLVPFDVRQRKGLAGPEVSSVPVFLVVSRISTNSALLLLAPFRAPLRCSTWSLKPIRSLCRLAAAQLSPSHRWLCAIVAAFRSSLELNARTKVSKIYSTNVSYTVADEEETSQKAWVRKATHRRREVV